MAHSPTLLQVDGFVTGSVIGQHVWLRAVDRLLAVCTLVVALPVMLLVGFVVVLLSRRSPLVAHLRVGVHGEQFWMFKFRSMWPKADWSLRDFTWVERVTSSEVLEIKPKRDPRVTSRFAAFCRTYSLDELPQLFHVATGRMSLVGPRPLTQFELSRYYAHCQREILALPPGLTGLWQTRGRNFLSYKQRVRWDRFLARNYSWALYFRILLGTIPRVTSGNGAW